MKQITNYELVTKHFDGILHVAIPKDGLPSIINNSEWTFESSSLRLTINDLQEIYLNIPEPMIEALNNTKILNIIDIDREQVIQVMKTE